MEENKHITVIIPCHNEEKGLEKMLSTFDRSAYQGKGYDIDIIVVDNNSTDDTVNVARRYAVETIHESKRGKGNALVAGFAHISDTTDYIVMLDGDGTYLLKELPRMIEPLESNFCHVVVGSRLQGKMSKSSLKYPNRVANWFFTFLVRRFYVANVTDVLSGYFAFKPGVVKLLAPHLTSHGFAIEMEIITKCQKLGFELYSVPITYDPREGVSKLNTVSDGLAILAMFFKNLAWRPDTYLKESVRVMTLL